MHTKQQATSRHSASLASTHVVLRNTYLLLGMTTLFSAITCALTVVMNLPYPGIIVSIVGMIGLSMLTNYLSNSAWGLLSCFAFTGFMGYILGPIINMFLSTYINGSALVFTALGSTGLIFFALSAYVLTTKKDFSFLGGVLFIGIMAVFLASIAGLFFNMPILHLLISGAFALISSAYILYDTSNIIHNGETNYIRATVSMYINLFNLFISLLRIFAAFAGNRN